MVFYPSSQPEFKHRFCGCLEREQHHFLGTYSSDNCYFILLVEAMLVLGSG